MNALKGEKGDPAVMEPVSLPLNMNAVASQPAGGDATSNIIGVEPN